MEDKTQISNSESSDRNEKTVVMSSNSKAENSKPKGKATAPDGDNSKEKEQDSSSKNTNPKSSEDFIKDSKSKSSVAPAVAAGVGAAIVSGAAGVAFGATNSDKIKEVVGNVFGAEETPPPTEEVPEAEVSTSEADTGAQAVSGGNSVQGGTEENTTQTVSETPEAEVNEDSMSTLEISGTDQEGNVYSVSFLDIDGDGEYDVQTAEFQTVDGFTITYTEFGNSLDPAFANDILLAGNTDYVECGLCDVSDVNMMDSYLYEIQPGDTLSEIAAANNTSVEQLMDLNPQISDPDLIYAGNNLIVPDGDSFVYPENSQSNTFIAEGYDLIQEDGVYAEESIETVDEILDDSMFVEDEYYVSEEQTELPNQELGSIDWESFYDNPVENPYTNELDAMDFEAMETPQSYNEMDYGMEGFGLDESGIGFI